MPVLVQEAETQWGIKLGKGWVQSWVGGFPPCTTAGGTIFIEHKASGTPGIVQGNCLGGR